MKPIRLCAALILLSGLAACGSSPPARYYTLQAPAGGGTVNAGSAGFMIEVLPVIVPAQADQPQIMLRTGAGSIAPLYSDRWSAPLGDELRSALSDGLTRELGALDIRVVRPPAETPVWRVQTDVQRFDVSTQGPAVLDVTWRARPISLKGQALICRSVITVPAAGGEVSKLVAAQQQAVALLARTIASGIRRGGQGAEPAGPEVSLQGCKTVSD